jgi:hypothetical protein
MGRLVFPSPSASDKPLSENTFNKVLRTLGYASDEMSAHGFRSTASSLLNDSMSQENGALMLSSVP